MNIKVLVSLSMMLVGGMATAQTIVVGTADTNNFIPFGGGDYGLNGLNGPAPIAEYQQVYSSSVFQTPETIDSLTFYCTPPWCPGSLNPINLSSGSYRLFLSTTAAAVDGLGTDLRRNIGADETLVYAGGVPAATGRGPDEEFTFDLSHAFSYNPTLGNLLLTVKVANQGPETIGLDAENTGISTSRALVTYSGNSDADPGGLVTGFGLAGSASAPEINRAPAASGLMLLFGALAILYSRRRPVS